MNVLRLNIISNVAGKLWNILIGLAFIAIYLRLLGAEAYGLVAFFTMLLSTLQILEFGLGTTINRELARYSISSKNARDARDLSRTMEEIYFLVAICIGGALVLAAPALATGWLRVQTLPLSTVTTAVAEMGIAIALLWPCSLYNNGLIGLERQALQNIIGTVLYTLRTVGAVGALIFFGRSIEIYFLWQIIFGFVQLAVLAFFFWRFMPHSPERPRFQFAQLRRIWRFTLGLGATGLVSFVLSQMDKVLLSRMLPLVLFGYYGVANQFNIASRMLPNALFTAFFPRFSALIAQGNETEVRRLYHRGCQFVSLVVFPAAMTGVFFASQVIRIWTGSPQIAQAAGPIASVLLLGSAFNSVMGTPYNVTVARGWTSFGFYNGLVSAIFFGPVIVVLVTAYGGLGAAIAWALLNCGYLAISAPIIHARVLRGELKTWYLTDVGSGFLASTAVPCIVKLALPADISPWLTIVCVGSTWAASTICCALALPETRQFTV
ncbi:MAG TPA: oligosaccharide flippase family protein, partial [Rhizomicrobium sp.]